ncbi:apolipophorins [Caerostris darwini]|uniref:Apolipophorins n=1 Tax=Caerostris darwini TaxID=1538125 RepID=A0AAV4QIN3_9ARAC|nr:apolipophorins [Caerostris darwini]
MVLRLAIIFWLGCLAAAGPVPWDDSKCAQQCNGGTKYQYSEQTSYIYSFESSNSLEADGASDLSMSMRATVKLTAVSKCEMVLQITDVTQQHGPIQETSSTFIDELKRNPMPFSWNDGKIEHVCPSPEDSNDVNNIKRAIISAFQNTMRSFEANLLEKEVDVLGSCDTEYTVKENKNDKFVFTKTKDIATCTDHIKGQTLLLASFYESSSHRQHLPFLSGEKLHCEQTINNGIVEEVTCEEKAAFKPLMDLGYTVVNQGSIKIKKLSSEPASRIQYRAPQKETLVFKYNPTSRKDDSLEAEAQNVLRHICSHSEELITKNAAHSVHKLVYIIRRLSAASLERIFQSLKNKQLCSSRKTLTIYLDALKAASSGGSIAVFSKLIATGEVRKTDAFLWLTLLPFTSYVEEESIAATLPLLRKETATRQALLGVSSLAYKYCTTRSNCDNSNAVKSVSSSLKQFLGDKCKTSNKEEETQTITALKAFGNLGYIGESATSILECASQSSNKVPVRIAAIESFRRSPCTEEVAAKLLDLYKDKNEEDEVRIAALIALSKCGTQEIIRHVLEAYSSENSNQVKVFTWSFLKNLKSSSNPLKVTFQDYLWLEDLEPPHSTDITKFSRNFQISLFSQFLNVGDDLEANVIYSKNSFLPRSMNLGLKSSLFGNQLDMFQVGGRAEDLEHILEILFGPRGLLPNYEINDVWDLISLPIGVRKRRSAESYKSKIEALSERLGYSRGQSPHGSAYIRVLGHELGWINPHKDALKKFGDFSIDALLREIANTKAIDVAKNLLFLDVTCLFPSVTGRAYKLAANGSLTLGLKADGQIDLQKQFPNSRVLLEGTAQPSILADTSASFTIHSENFEPGVRAETSFTAGLDIKGKFEIKDFRLLHVKLGRRQNRQELISSKRTLYSVNHNGVRELPKPESYNLNYCTKYVQHILGARYCVSATIPHIYNAQGKAKIPFVRSMEASLVVEQTDPNMEGYELLLELPEYWVEPKEYFQLCLRHLAAKDRDSTKGLCNIATAYVMECERNYIELNLPSKCLTCTAPDGSTIQHGDRKKYENLSKKAADVVFIVEDHDCNKAVVNDIGNLARSIDRELQNDGFRDINFGVVGYGGDIGKPQIYTVKGNTFFSSRDINSVKDRIKAESQKVESSRAFEAMKLAVTDLVKSDAAKSFILLSCSACKYDYKSLLYPVIQQILLERGITLHVVSSAEITIRKSSIKEKDIIGADPGTVYHAKDVTQKDLVGEPALRSQISLPKDLCVALSQDVSGSFFSSHSLNKASSGDIKNWRSVFARKFLKSVQSFQCQWCDCTSTRDHLPNTVCQPCETKRPKLPFSLYLTADAKYF